MWHHLENYTISLGYIGAQTQNNPDFSIYVLKADLVTVPGRLKQPIVLQWTSVILGWLFTVIGSYFRYILYRYLFKKYKAKEFTPIDLLILVASTIQHVLIVCAVINATLITSIGSSLADIGGPWHCISSRWLFQFGMSYSIIGGLGIAIFRILYIKHDAWVKYTIREKTWSK